MYYDRSLKNGEPFHSGDMVQILVGPHRDRVVRVIEAFDYAACAGAHCIRVDLGVEARKYENLFRSTQILKVSSSSEEKQNEDESSKATDAD